MLSVGWEEDFNEILFSLRKNKERLKNLRELTTSGKISSETFEALYKKFETELLESESKRQNLLEKLLTLQKDLQEELELLESELKKLEVKLAYSLINEDHYEKVSTAFKYAIEEVSRELSSVSTAIEQLAREAPEVQEQVVNKALKRLDESF
jgi:hemoglobin-like flavoprotein